MPLIVALIAAAAAIISAFPMSWSAALALPETLSAQRSAGSLWNGEVTGIRSPAGRVERVRLNLKPAGLLGGEAGRVDVTGPGFRLTADMRLGGADNVIFTGNIAAMEIRDPRLVGLNGDVRIEVPTFRFDGQGCTEASGTASTNVLQMNGALYGWTGPALSGPVTCQNGALLVRLTGQDTRQSVTATLQATRDGRYNLDATVDTAEPGAGLVLPLLGFTGQGRMFRLTEQGSILDGGL